MPVRVAIPLLSALKFFKAALITLRCMPCACTSGILQACVKKGKNRKCIRKPGGNALYSRRRCTPSMACGSRGVRNARARDPRRAQKKANGVARLVCRGLGLHRDPHMCRRRLMRSFGVSSHAGGTSEAGSSTADCEGAPGPSPSESSKCSVTADLRRQAGIAGTSPTAFSEEVRASRRSASAASSDRNAE